MQLTGEMDERICASFVARAIDIGFPVPCLPLRLKLVEAASCWTLFIQAVPAEPLFGKMDWIGSFAPMRLEFGSRDVVRADFDRLPDAWARAFRGVELDALYLDRDGQARFSVSGSRATLASFARRLRAEQRSVIVRRVAVAPSSPRLLTDPQDQAVRVAVASGYYLIPRPLNLRQLSVTLSISSASLSERLRRAEGRIVTRYVYEGGKSPWDERTLFDTRPLARGVPSWPTLEDEDAHAVS